MPKHILDLNELSRWPSVNHRRTALSLAGHKAGPGRHNRLAMFEPGALGRWVWSYLRYAFNPRHNFPGADRAQNKSSIYRVPDSLRVSVAGDWGTGTSEALAVAEQMVKWDSGAETDLTIHLGDVYYVGDEQELRENCLQGDGTQTPPQDCVGWPLGRLGSFALNGNHEMYANGNAYFDTFLPRLGMLDERQQPSGQGPSFFCLENEHWRIIGLDTGYNSVGLPIISLLPFFRRDCELPGKLMAWLRERVRPHDQHKGTVLLSHHQYFSAFEEDYPKPARQLGEFFDAPVIWLWGHEHRLAGYKLSGTEKLQVHGRCIGHSGMPIAVKDPQDGAVAGQLLFYDKRVNPAYQKDELGFNGFAQLRFEGKSLAIDYKSLSPAPGNQQGEYLPDPTVLLTESFEWDGSQLVSTRVEKRSGDPAFVVKN